MLLPLAAPRTCPARCLARCRRSRSDVPSAHGQVWRVPLPCSSDGRAQLRRELLHSRLRATLTPRPRACRSRGVHCVQAAAAINLQGGYRATLCVQEPNISRPMNPHQDTREIKRYFRRCAAGVGPSRLPTNTTHRTKHVRSASRLPKRHDCGDRVIARAARDRGAQKASTGPAHAPMQPWVTQPMAAKTA